MNKLKTLSLLPILGLTACQQNSSPVKEESAKRPNFIFFITDDIGTFDLGCYGNKKAQTPNIDKMAAEGILFTNAYLTASSCSPSRCSIITSRYPHNTGAPELHTKLPVSQIRFPQLMKEAGYYTILSGKNHIGDVSAAFDTIDWGGGPGGEQFWTNHLRSRPKDMPFFFYLSSYDAHRKWQIDSTAPIFDPANVWVPPMLYDGDLTRQDLANYYHEVSRTDYYLGQIMLELEKQGIAEDTYVIYMTDNGRPFPRAKTRCYESGMKTPFIIWKKGTIEPAICESLISSIDVGPTLFELAGIEAHKNFQGVSFANLLQNPKEKCRDYIFAEHNWHVYQSHERMVRFGNFMYIRNNFNEKLNMSVESAPVFPAGIELWNAYEKGLTNAQQEDIFINPRPKDELYNIVDDPFNFNNLADNPEYAKELEMGKKLIAQWTKETGDNVPKNPTPDREKLNREKIPGFEHKEMPGDATGADTITQKGPVLIGDVFF